MKQLMRSQANFAKKEILFPIRRENILRWCGMSEIIMHRVADLFGWGLSNHMEQFFFPP